MLQSIGHPIRLVLTGPDPLKPRLFSHVYVEVFCKGRWIPLDGTMPYAMGWAPRALLTKNISFHIMPNMLADDIELQGIDAVAVAPVWLKGLIRAVSREAIQPKDPRVRSLWNLLRQRQLLRRSPWMRGALLRIWQGLPARRRPNTTRNLVWRLRRWGILPSRNLRVMAPCPKIELTTGFAKFNLLLRRVGGGAACEMMPVQVVQQPVYREVRG